MDYQPVQDERNKWISILTLRLYVKSMFLAKQSGKRSSNDYLTGLVNKMALDIKKDDDQAILRDYVTKSVVVPME